MCEFISTRDFETSPSRYVEYLRDAYRNAEKTLSQPVQQWPKGSSYEIAHAIMLECEEAHYDVALEFGLYDVNGKLIGYAEN